MSYDNTRTRQNNVVGSAIAVQDKTPLELFEEHYFKLNNQSMSEEQREFVQKLITDIQEDSV